MTDETVQILIAWSEALDTALEMAERLDDAMQEKHHAFERAAEHTLQARNRVNEIARDFGVAL